MTAQVASNRNSIQNPTAWLRSNNERSSWGSISHNVVPIHVTTASLAIDSRSERSSNSFEPLFRTGGFCPLPAHAVHFVGDLWRLSDTLSPALALAPRRFTGLEYPHGTPPLAVSADRGGKLAGNQSRRQTIPGRISAPLPRHRGGCIGLRCESRVLWPTDMDRS